MLDFTGSILTDFWATVAEMSPYLLFGFLVAGILSVLISPGFIRTHLGGGGLWPLLKASLFGIPLPLCSCGVIPVAMSLRQHGAGRGATISFLLSTPQTGIDSFLVTFSLLGPVFAVFRPVVTFVTGLLGGIGVQIFGERVSQNTPAPQNSAQSNNSSTKKTSKPAQALRYGFVTLPRDIGRAILIGMVVAAIISAAVPDDFFAERLGTGIFAMVVMMFLGIPVYVCATASVPVAAALIAKGLTPGAALVFLMTGPATNAAAFATIWKILGRRTALIYIITVAGCSLAAGILLDYFAAGVDFDIVRKAGWMLPGYVKHISAVVLLTVLGFAVFNQPKKLNNED